MGSPRHFGRTIAVLLLIALIALPIVLSACSPKDVDSPEPPATEAEKKARQEAKMNDPNWGGGGQKGKMGGGGGGNRPPGAPGG